MALLYWRNSFLNFNLIYHLHFNEKPLEDDMMLMMMLSGAMGGNKAGIGKKKLFVSYKVRNTLPISVNRTAITE